MLLTLHDPLQAALSGFGVLPGDSGGVQDFNSFASRSRRVTSRPIGWFRLRSFRPTAKIDSTQSRSARE